MPHRPPAASPPAARPALLLAAAALAAGPAAAQGPPPVVVNNAFFETVDAVDLAAERPGMLRAVPFREGDRVEVDEVVAELWDEVPRAQLATYQLQAEDKISELYAFEAARVAEAELKGLLDANRKKEGVVVESEIERARLSLKQAKAQVLKARQERELAKLRAAELRAELQSYAVSAPFPGVVQRVQHLPGESVRQGDPILHLVNTDRLRVVANVPLEQVLLLRVGDLATGTINVGDVPLPAPIPPFAGRVTFIDPTEQERTTAPTVRVFVEVPNPAGVYRAGMQATLQVRPGTAVPEGAGDAAESLIDGAANLTGGTAGDLIGDLVPPRAAGGATERTSRFRPTVEPAGAIPAGGGVGRDGAERDEIPRTRRYADEPSRR